MKNRCWIVCAGALVLGTGLATLPAQENALQPSAAGFKPASKLEQYSPLDALKAFEASEEGPYHLGEGDEIFLDVWNHAEASGKQVIGPDGQITVHLAGSVKIAGLTRDEAAKQIHDKILAYYLDPSVTVRVEKYTNNRIYILGRVAHPGALQFDRTPYLLDAITLAGGLPIGGIGADKAGITRCAVFRGRDRVAWVDLRPLLKEGNLAYNLRLQKNDLIYIPDAGDQSVYVLGEVHHPGAYRLTSEMSFLDALSQAGGPTEDAAPGKMELVRPDRGLRQSLAMDDFRHAKPQSNISLNDGDIIYVPRRNIAKIGYVLQKFAPLGSIAILGAAVKP